MAIPFTVADFQKMTFMDPAGVAAVVANRPDFLEARGDALYDTIMARLRKRYDVAAMAANPPTIVKLWWVALLTRDAYGARGYDPSAADDEKSIHGAAEAAEKAILEAADSEKGMYDLPLLATNTGSGVSRGGPLAYSETSPYVGMTNQRTTGRQEDSGG